MNKITKLAGGLIGVFIDFIKTLRNRVRIEANLNYTVTYMDIHDEQEIWHAQVTYRGAVIREGYYATEQAAKTMCIRHSDMFIKENSTKI